MLPTYEEVSQQILETEALQQLVKKGYFPMTPLMQGSSCLW